MTILTEKACSIDWCAEGAYQSGLCLPHDKRRRKYGDPEIISPSRNLCSRPGCPRLSMVHSECCPQHMSEGGALASGGSCSVSECDRDADTRGLCTPHYHRLVRGGDPLPGTPVTPSVSVTSVNPMRKCAIRGCERPGGSQFACNLHQIRMYYGLSVLQLDMTLTAEECEICHEPVAGRGIQIDHDHNCCPGGNVRKCGNCIRGVLCIDCNRGLGAFTDSVTKLQSAIRYLGGDPGQL